MSEANRVHGPRAMILIARAVMLDLVRGRSLYGFLALMVCFMVLALGVGLLGMEDAATSLFLLNLGMTLAHLAAHVMALALAVRQLPAELEHRTIHTLLARPLRRSWVLLGKWAACTAAGFLLFTVLLGMACAAVPGVTLAPPEVGEVLLTTALSVGVLTSLGILLSLSLPKGLAFTLSVLILLLGAPSTQLVQHAAAGGRLYNAVLWCTHYLPDFSKWNLITRFTDGAPVLGAADLAGLVLYAALFMSAALVAGVCVFERKAI